jgi:periplasmic protein TonB
MFDDFRPAGNEREARRRMGGSITMAASLYVGLGVLVISGTTAATKTVVEHMTQVEFAPPPPPPPPPPPEPLAAQPVAATRPKVKRKELKAPDKLPDEKPKESDAPLSDAPPSGPVEGFLNGVEGGTGTGVARAAPAPPPPPKPEPLIAPVPSKSNAAPAYSSSARRKEIEGVVVVAFDVLENGTVANVTIVSGPEELRDNVLKTVATWRFQPAKRGGKPQRTRQTRSIRFRLDDA